MSTHQTAKTQYIKTSNGTTFAYRLIGQPNGIPLVMHMHFRGNMDFWDPLLVNTLAANRPVLIFDQSGVGRSTGPIATTFSDWAANVISLVTALGFKKIDLFGFSMGGCAVQMVALNAPNLVRKLIIAGSGPSEPGEQVKGIVWPRDLPPSKAIGMLSSAVSNDEIEAAISFSFFPDTAEGRGAAKKYFARIRSRTKASAGEEAIHTLLPKEKAMQQREAYKDWSIANSRNSFGRLRELGMPVMIMNGDDDKLIPTSRSWELLRGIENAELVIYPRAGHGFLWQYASRVAEDVNRFLETDLTAPSSKL